MVAKASNVLNCSLNSDIDGCQESAFYVDLQLLTKTCNLILFPDGRESEPEGFRQLVKHSKP